MSLFTILLWISIVVITTKIINKIASSFLISRHKALPTPYGISTNRSFNSKLSCYFSRWIIFQVLFTFLCFFRFSTFVWKQNLIQIGSLKILTFPSIASRCIAAMFYGLTCTYFGKPGNVLDLSIIAFSFRSYKKKNLSYGTIRRVCVSIVKKTSAIGL